SSRVTRFSSSASMRKAPTPCSESFARLPLSLAGSSPSSSSSASTSRSLPRAAMRPRAPPLPPLLSARLRRRLRRRRRHDVDELRRRLGGQRFLRRLQSRGAGVDLGAPAPAAAVHGEGGHLGRTGELLALRVLRLALLPHGEQRRRVEDRRAG